MAISSGSSPHRAWVSINGQEIPILSGSAQQAATRQSMTFSGELPLAYPGMEALFSTLGDNDSSVLVLSRGQKKALVTGEIDHAKISYIKGVISFSGRCKSAKLHEKKTAEKWINKSHGEIIQDLAKRVGLTAEIDSSTLKAGRYMQIDWTRLTDNVSYAMVIHKAAELLGARWWVDAKGVLHVKAPGSGEGVYTINYSGGSPKSADILDLDISRNIQAGKGVKVNVKSFHPGKKQAFTGSYTIGGVGETREYNYHLPGHSQDHCDKHAKSMAAELARHELQLNARMVGDPSIDVAMKLQLNGTAFAQSFDMDSIHHSFGMAGHVMNITAKSAKKGRK